MKRFEVKLNDDMNSKLIEIKEFIGHQTKSETVRYLILRDWKIMQEAKKLGE